MAQYGKNFYGASYYGRRGVFGGQYTSEEINSGNPLTGPLTNTVVAILPTSTYVYSSDVFQLPVDAGVHTFGGESYIGLSAGSVTGISLIGNDISVRYYKKTDGGSMRIQVTTLVDGAHVDTYDQTVNTAGADAAATYSISGLTFGEHQITITASTSMVYIQNVTARTTDVTVEFRTKTGEAGAWSAWETLTLTKAPIDGVSNGFTLTGDTSNVSGKDYYQFKAVLGSSDSTTTPFVKSCKFQSAVSNNYSRTGQLKYRIDLGTGVVSLGDLTYTATVPDGAKVFIRTRTAATEPLTADKWSSWSAPYRNTGKRFRLKSYTPTQNGITESHYIITPVINPQNPASFITLQSWIGFVTQQYVTDQNTYIKIQVLDKDFARLTTKRGGLEKWIEFTSTDNESVAYDLSSMMVGMKQPIRLKIILTRPVDSLSSPVVDLVTYRAMARYEEVKDFSPDDLEAFASPVYGNNTGIIDLTYNDTVAVGDGTLATPTNLGFIVPTPIGGSTEVTPNYVIDTNSETFGTYRSGEELTLYWKSQSGLINKSKATTDPDDIIVAQAKAWPENNLLKAEAKLFKSYQYGRGFIVYPSVLIQQMTNAFQPALDPALGKYSYYISNGWVSVNGATNANANISVLWNANGGSNISDISEVNGSKDNGRLYNDSIKLSVNAPNVKGEVPWVSDEKIFETVVNEDGSYREKIIPIEGEDIPSIDSEVSISENPYVVDIIYRSVVSGNKIVPEERVQLPQYDGNGDPVVDGDGHVIYEYPKVFYMDDSFEEVLRNRAEVVRKPSSQGDYMDVLPTGRVLNVIGIYRTPGIDSDDINNPIASFYIEGTDFNLVGNYIDWSIAYDTNGNLKPMCAAPAVDETYYVTYTYNHIRKVYVSFRCQYKEYETNKAIWTSKIVKEYSGTCSPGSDFRSEPLPSKTSPEWGVIPDNVDLETLFYVLNDDSIWVNTFLDDDVVVGTLRNRIPSLNWFPTIHNGYYYIGKNEYYLFTEPREYTPTRSEVETATNATYVPGKYGNGIFIEEGTTNLILNSGFDKLGDKVVIFQDSLTRTV